MQPTWVRLQYRSRAALLGNGIAQLLVIHCLPPTCGCLHCRCPPVPIQTKLLMSKFWMLLHSGQLLQPQPAGCLCCVVWPVH